MLSSIGFSQYDTYLLIFCTVGASLGSFAHAIMLTIADDGPPTSTKKFKFAPPEIRSLRGIWLYLRVLVGAILGFVFGLYFVGTLHETPASFAKIWALSFVVGYAAPKIWLIKEASIIKAVKSDSCKVDTP